MFCQNLPLKLQKFDFISIFFQSQWELSPLPNDECTLRNPEGLLETNEKEI